MIKRLAILTVAALCCGTVMANDWKTIYNGKDLSQIETKGNWLIQEDGSLFLQPRKGESGWKRYASYLWFKGDYVDFECEFEYKHEKRGNSGFYFRVSDTVDPTKHGVEVQLLDSFDKKKKLGFHDLGGIIKLVGFKQGKGGPLTNAAKPAGEWNTFRAILKDNKLTVFINDKKVQDAVDLVKNEVMGQKLAPKGRICIQDHGQPFWLRNVRVKSL